MTVELLWWLWVISSVLFYLIPPFLLYMFSWQKPRIKRIYAAFITIFVGYIVGNVSVGLKWDYLRENYNLLQNTTLNLSLAAPSGTGNLTFWLLFGWIPVSIYVFFCWWVLNILRKRGVF